MNMFSGFAYGKQISTETSFIQYEMNGGGADDCLQSCLKKAANSNTSVCKKLPLTNKK